MNTIYKKLFSTAAILSAGLYVIPVQALETGDWIIRFGVTQVAPNDSSTDTAVTAATDEFVGVDSGESVTFNIGYMLTSNVAVDVLAAWPFKHDIVGAGSLAGLGKIAETKHLPPTVSLQYHFKPTAKVRPYVGAGINYTTFMSEKTTGALTGTTLSLDDSWGLAGQLGIDFDINDNWFGYADARYIDIDTDASNPGAAGNFEVEIDPWVFSIGLGKTF